MKRIVYLFAALVALSTTAFATNTTSSEADASINNYVRGYGNSFIFNEAGIEFSVFADGQFDFYLPNYGPDVSVGINTPGFSLSFNTGYNYNPYVQYDEFGAIIQIENTPIYYDYYGRVNQIGNILINYNSFGRISRVGGLNVYYRNNVFYRYDGFINIYNRSYVYRPWHRFYAVPHMDFRVVHVNPYRQFYAPVRHIYYRPYTNNVRHYNIRRANNGHAVRRATTVRRGVSYAQTPRNRTERSIRTRVTRKNVTIANTRATRVNRTARTSAQRPSNRSTARSNSRVTTPNRTVTTSRTVTTRSNGRTTTPTRTVRNSSTNTNRIKNNVTRSKSTGSNNTRSTSLRKPNTANSRTYNKSTSNTRNQRSAIQTKSKSSSVKARSSSSRTSNQSSTRSNSRRLRG